MFYYANGNVTESWDYVYNEKGQKTQINVTSFENGEVAKRGYTQFNPDTGEAIKTEYAYNPKTASGTSEIEKEQEEATNTLSEKLSNKIFECIVLDDISNQNTVNKLLALEALAQSTGGDKADVKGKVFSFIEVYCLFPCLKKCYYKNILFILFLSFKFILFPACSGEFTSNSDRV